MHISLIQRAAFLCASAFAAVAPAAFSQDWTSFKLDELTNYSFSHTHRSDGRFVFGTVGKVFVQDTFGAAATTAVANAEEVFMDPSFVALRSDTQGLAGGGGFMGPSGLFLFDPSSPSTSIVKTPLATLQNYTGVFWKHPTSGREGWLVIGANGAGGGSNITFISTSGVTGAVTSVLSDYSGGLAVDAQGNVFTALSGPVSFAANNQVIKFTADQINAAVEGVLSITPVPLTRENAAVIFTADASGSLAVDAAGRVWAGGYQISHLQAFDPATGGNRRFQPDHAPLANAFGPPSYSPKAFTRSGVDYVSFLANDSFYATGSDLVLGYRPVSELNVRSVQFTAKEALRNEGDAQTVLATVTLTPAAAETVTVPVTVSGTATAGSDYTSNVENVVFAPGETSKIFSINVIDDAVKGESENVVISLGTPAPAAQAGLGALASDTFTLTIVDNDPMPFIGFASAAQTVGEKAGTVNVTVNANIAVTEDVTVPITVSGTAGSTDFSVPASAVFAAGETSTTVAIQVLDDTTANEADETVILTLGTPTPAGQAALNLPQWRQFVLTIQDDDAKARVLANQEFETLRVGASFSHLITTAGGTATKWSAKGLPPGLKMNADGTITGRPTKAGEYDQVIITATNAFGVSTSVAFLLNVQPFPAGAVGTFTGLVDRTGTATEKLGAYVTLTTTANATYTGKVVIGKKSYAVKGNLDSATANPSGAADLKNGTATQRLEFALNPATGALSGNLPGGAILAGWRAQTATERTGIYNFLAAVPGEPAASVPQGGSYGSLKLSAKAVASVAGMAADGSKITSSSPLSINGDVVIYQVLYTAPGTFSGRVNLADDLAHSITGNFTWSKPQQTAGAVYASGWEVPLALTARGGKYRPAAGATLPLDAPESSGNNARLSLQDGGIEAVGALTNPQNFGVQIASTTKVTIAAPHKIKLTNTTGVFSGSVTLGEGSLRKVIPFQGLLVPDASTANAFDSEGFGYFILPSTTPGVSRSGAAVLELDPGT